MEEVVMSRLPVEVSENLSVSIAGHSVRLTPSQSLDLAEDLARKAFRRALAEEAALPDISPAASRK